MPLKIKQNKKPNKNHFEWLLLISPAYSRKVRFIKGKAFTKSKAFGSQDASITGNNYHLKGMDFTLRDGFH